MKTLRALIIDDEPLAHEVLLQYCELTPNVEVVGQTYSAMEAFRFLSEQSVDLIFLDIQLPKIKGLDLLRSLADPPLVIVTSAYAEYAVESYELDICDYLLKPFRLERFLKAVNKAWSQVQSNQPEALPSNAELSNNAQKIFIKSDKKHVQIDLAEIYFLESYGNYVKVWLKESYHLTPGTLSSFEEQLPKSQFLRIHKSYVIQRLFIDYIEGNQMAMKNHRVLPIGKNYRSSVKEILS